jgi:hypothetical protein
MDHARLRAQDLPIGSGVVEAACKTLATRRMKPSPGWSSDGGQAILSFRALAQSERFDAAWKLLCAQCCREFSFSKKRRAAPDSPSISVRGTPYKFR